MLKQQILEFFQQTFVFVFCFTKHFSRFLRNLHHSPFCLICQNEQFKSFFQVFQILAVKKERKHFVVLKPKSGCTFFVLVFPLRQRKVSNTHII